MDITPIIISLITAGATVLASAGFWNYLSGKRDKSSEILGTVDKLARKVEKLDQKVDQKVGNVDKKVERLGDSVQDVHSEVLEVKSQVDTIEFNNEQDRAITARVRILRFEDEVQDGKRHSKDAWDQCMKDIKFYEEYVENHPKFENGITGPTCEHLRKTYQGLLDKHDWEVEK